MSLKTAVFLCFFGGVLLLAAGISYALPRFVNMVTLNEVETTVATRTASLAQDLGRTLYSDWEELGGLAASIATREPDLVRAYLDGVASSARVSWVGFAGTDGIVRASSDRLLEGQNVSSRPWFSAGLDGGFAGDVHEALLLQSHIAPNASEPLRFIDLALPVTNAAGRTIGVIGMHINAAWLTEYLSESAEIREMDVVLVASNGTVVASSLPGGTEGIPDVDTLRAAATGAPVVMSETWPDGVSYMSAVVPQVAYETLPSFGWRVVGRVPTDISSIPRGELVRHVGTLGLAAAALFALAALGFWIIFLSPIERLSDIAERVSHGEVVYPPRSRTTSEAKRLAGAIARWQSNSTASHRED